MEVHRIRLVDQSLTVLATAEVADEGGLFAGKIDLHGTRGHLRALFDEFEEIVNGQMLSFLDEIQEKIGAIPIRAVFDDGVAIHVKDLQVYPSTGDVSFRLADALSKSVGPTFHERARV